MMRVGDAERARCNTRALTASPDCNLVDRRSVLSAFLPISRYFPKFLVCGYRCVKRAGDWSFGGAHRVGKGAGTASGRSAAFGAHGQARLADAFGTRDNTETTCSAVV